MKKLCKTLTRAALAGAGIYLWAQTPRREHPGLGRLRRYRYAHRGLHDLEKGIPENTLPAFAAAAAKGYGAELDVHMTLDRRLVVIHDSRLERLCGTSAVVEELTYDELRALPILGTAHRAPLLSEVLPLFAGRTPLIVELKTWKHNAAQLCTLADAALRGSGCTYCVESFDPRAVRWFRKNSPETVRGQLSEDFLAHGDDSSLPLWQRFAMTHLLTNALTRPDFIAYNDPDREKLPVRIACGLLGAQLVSWTIRSLEAMHRAEKAGAIVIFEHFTP